MNEMRCWYTPVFEDIIDRSSDQDREDVARFISNLTKTVVSREFSNSGGWQSPIYRKGDVTQFESILDKIQLKMDIVCQQLKMNLSITNYWINVNYKSNSNLHHIHPDSILSGVVYLDASSDQGSLRLMYPSRDIIQYGLHTLKLMSLSSLYDDIVIHPMTDKVVIFPSYIPHCVEPNKTDRPRVSLAFNVAYPSK